MKYPDLRCPLTMSWQTCTLFNKTSITIWSGYIHIVVLPPPRKFPSVSINFHSQLPEAKEMWKCADDGSYPIHWSQQILHHLEASELKRAGGWLIRGSWKGRPRGMGWGGRWEGGSGWGTHVNPWLIHVNVWQKPLQYCKVISLQLIKII